MRQISAPSKPFCPTRLFCLLARQEIASQPDKERSKGDAPGPLWAGDDGGALNQPAEAPFSFWLAVFATPSTSAFRSATESGFVVCPVWRTTFI